MNKEPKRGARFQREEAAVWVLKYLGFKGAQTTCALTSDFNGGCPPPPSRSLCQKVNLQLQLIKFLGN